MLYYLPAKAPKYSDVIFFFGSRGLQHRILDEVANTDIQVMQADATSSTDMQAFVDACMTRHQRIDVLINNVGMNEKGDPATMAEETW